MNIELCRKTTEGSLSGSMSFPQVVTSLMEMGLESYLVDMVRWRKIFYMPSGETYEEAIPHDSMTIANDFQPEMVKAAIRASQEKKVTYLEFMDRIAKAGVTNYTVYLTGRRAVYVGRTGEHHVEHFPTGI